MTTIDLLADGIGPGRVWVRSVRGELHARHVSDWFGAIEWESDDAVLLDVNGRHSFSTVRCVAQSCENAEDPGPRVELRPARQPRAARSAVRIIGSWSGRRAHVPAFSAVLVRGERVTSLVILMFAG